MRLVFDAGIIIILAVCLFGLFIQLGDARLEIDKDIVHIEEKDGFCHK